MTKRCDKTRFWRPWALALLLCMCRTAAAPQPSNPRETMTELKFKIDRDESFAPNPNWPRESRISTRATPKIISGQGIAINAPREVLFSEGPILSGEDAQFIVCVATEFVYDTLGYGTDFMDHVVLVLVDAQTHEEYCASALLADDSTINENLIPFPDKGKSGLDFSGTTHGEVLRGNLAKIFKLPAEEREYIVYAVLGPYRSNTLSVKLVKRKPEPDAGP
jgi:hypothetical protein